MNVKIDLVGRNAMEAKRDRQAAQNRATFAGLPVGATFEVVASGRGVLDVYRKLDDATVEASDGRRWGMAGQTVLLAGGSVLVPQGARGVSGYVAE